MLMMLLTANRSAPPFRVALCGADAELQRAPNQSRRPLIRRNRSRVFSRRYFAGSSLEARVLPWSSGCPARSPKRNERRNDGRRPLRWMLRCI